jgi:hypothetical protein
VLIVSIAILPQRAAVRRRFPTTSSSLVVIPSYAVEVSVIAQKRACKQARIGGRRITARNKHAICVDYITIAIGKVKGLLNCRISRPDADRRGAQTLIVEVAIARIQLLGHVGQERLVEGLACRRADAPNLEPPIGPVDLDVLVGLRVYRHRGVSVEADVAVGRAYHLVGLETDLERPLISTLDALKSYQGLTAPFP